MTQHRAHSAARSARAAAASGRASSSLAHRRHTASRRTIHRAPTRIGQFVLYGHRMLTIASRLDAMNRLGRAIADPTRARILLQLLDGPGYPAQLAESLGLTRTNVSNHLACLRGCGLVIAAPEGRRTRYEIADPHLAQALRSLLAVVVAVDDGVPCADPACAVPLCCGPGASTLVEG